MIGPLVPSPIGHALAGVAVAWSADLLDRHPSSGRLVAVSAGLAMLPDADLLIPGTHRMGTHSVMAGALVLIVAAVVTGKVTPLRASRFGGQARWRTSVICGLAYASHLLLDWLGADNTPPRGLQLFWPFSDGWYISGLDVFRQTARRQFLTAPIIRQNAIAVVQELAILVPILAALYLVRVKTVAGLAPQLAGGDHPAQ
jgi:inner membrane protein